MKEFNVVLAGVGGQGILLAAEILGTAAVEEGFNVRVSEIHGMAQRGGAVTSNVRIGESVFSPTVMEGQADVILGFEPVETLRNIRFASEKTHVVMSSGAVPPTVLSATGTAYPSLEAIREKIRGFTKKIVVVDADGLAREAGNVLTQNSVLIGALAATEKVPMKKESLMKALRELVPSKHLVSNVKAFNLGYEFARKSMGN